MPHVTATALAEKLNLSKGRISQYVSEGKLEGCFEGSGRNRRFDVEKVAEALGRRLDQGQLLGNGSSTRRALDEMEGDEPASAGHPVGASRLPDGDNDRYNLARTLKAEEEARRLRRQNAEADGLYVLASEAALQTQRLLGQEVAEFESVMRDAARRTADELGVDFKAVRAILLETWRTHRGRRARALEAAAGDATMTRDEAEADI